MSGSDAEQEPYFMQIILSLMLSEDTGGGAGEAMRRDLYVGREGNFVIGIVKLFQKDTTEAILLLIPDTSREERVGRFDKETETETLRLEYVIGESVSTLED